MKTVSSILKSLMNEHGINQPDLARETGLTQSTIQRILSGAIEHPKTNQLIPLCNFFKISLDEMLGFESHDWANTVEAEQLKGSVPIISWVQAGQFDEAVDLHIAGYSEDSVPRISGGDRVYALYVRGDSMTAPAGVTPSFPEGFIIHVDPDQSSGNGDCVIAKILGENAVTFKQLKIDDKTYLKPLNPAHPLIFDEFRVLGKVVGASIKL